MQRRFLSIWFRYLVTDWQTLRSPSLKGCPFAFAKPERGRKIITAINPEAAAEGVTLNMNVADAKAIFPNLEIIDTKPGREARLLKGLGEWCVRYAPIVAVDLPDGLILEITGCAHLWGGEASYLEEIESRLHSKGYHTQAAIADTVGAAWAKARFDNTAPVVESGMQAHALLNFPPASLRLEPQVIERLHKLGLTKVHSFINMPHSALKRRFGDDLIKRIRQALGQEEEYLEPISIPEPFQERLPCLEPIRTAVGIEVAILRMLESLCERLQKEGKGLRKAIMTCYRVDGKIEQVSIGTSKASNHTPHLFKLLELHISTIRPGFGIELFTLDATQVEDAPITQEALWAGKQGLNNQEVAELLDRLAGKLGANVIHRYLPDEHYWPERSIKLASALDEQPATAWVKDRPRPTMLLKTPVVIEVTAPVPDYPPMSFRYQDKVHYVRKSDGPERIEREWWADAGEHRDYYQVEDDLGQRYWIFRSGHYGSDTPSQWYLHGFFA